MSLPFLLLALTAQSPCPSPTPDPHNAVVDLSFFIRNAFHAHACDGKAERERYFTATNYSDTRGPVKPLEHVIESFGGKAVVSCNPPAFTRATYEKMIQAYEAELSRTEGAPRPLLLFVHGGLVPGSDAFNSAARRLCDFFAEQKCGVNPLNPDEYRETGIPREYPKLDAFPIFVNWNSGAAQAAKATWFASRTRQASPHGMITRVATRSQREQAMDEPAGNNVSHSEPNCEDKMNHIEVLHRTYNYLNAPNLWRFMQDEIADTFSLGHGLDAKLADEDIGRSDRVGLWLVRDIARMHQKHKGFRVVVVGHSMGAEYGAWLIETYHDYAAKHRLADDLAFDVIVLAPAVPYNTFERALRTGRIGHFRMFTMKNQTERVDHLTQFGFWKSGTRGIYPLSLLYYISGDLNPYPDFPLLGLERNLAPKPAAPPNSKAAPSKVIADVAYRLCTHFTPDPIVLSPTSSDAAEGRRSSAKSHGDFFNENDTESMRSITYIVNVEWAAGPAPWKPAATLPLPTALPPGTSPPAPAPPCAAHLRPPL